MTGEESAPIPSGSWFESRNQVTLVSITRWPKMVADETQSCFAAITPSAVIPQSSAQAGGKRVQPGSQSQKWCLGNRQVWAQGGRQATAFIASPACQRLSDRTGFLPRLLSQFFPVPELSLWSRRARRRLSFTSPPACSSRNATRALSFPRSMGPPQRLPRSSLAHHHGDPGLREQRRRRRRLLVRILPGPPWREGKSGACGDPSAATWSGSAPWGAGRCAFKLLRIPRMLEARVIITVTIIIQCLETAE